MVLWSADLDSVPLDFDKKGLPRTLAIAHRLCDELELRSVEIRAILHSEYKVARQTAQAYAAVISGRKRGTQVCRPIPTLNPDAGSASHAVESLREQLKDGTLARGTAILMVGHQPMLTHMARVLTRDKIPARTLPLDGSEAACLELRCDGSGILNWLLTQKSDALLIDLKRKIESKYDVAKFFLGAFVVNLGFVHSGEIWKINSPVALGLICLGFALALVGLSLTAATLFSYDRLMMPADFWTAASPDPEGDGHPARPRHWSVSRPPSQAHVILFYEMVHVWSAFFLPALACAFSAMATFLVALAHEKILAQISEGQRARAALPILVALTLVAVATLVIPLVVYYRKRRPELGFGD